MRQDRRRVYEGGYLRFANLIYQGEYLAGYAGENVVLRYDPRDITTLFVYRQRGEKDVFLTRAHAQNLETERLSLSEAKAIGHQLRQTHQEVTNQSVLEELQARTEFINELMEEELILVINQDESFEKETDSNLELEEKRDEVVQEKQLLKIRVYDYEKLRQEHGG
jgi:putative transposase